MMFGNPGADNPRAKGLSSPSSVCSVFQRVLVNQLAVTALGHAHQKCNKEKNGVSLLIPCESRVHLDEVSLVFGRQRKLVPGVSAAHRMCEVTAHKPIIYGTSVV